MTEVVKCQCDDPECGCYCMADDHLRKPATADRHGLSFCDFCFVDSATGRPKYTYRPTPSPYRELTGREREYIERVVALGEDYGVSLSHEDGYGAFLLEEFSELNADWLRCAKFEIKATTA